MQSPVLGGSAQAKPAVRSHNRWVVAIGVLKLLKAILFVLIGIGAINLLHKDVVDLFAKGLADLNFDPESHFVNVILDKVALLNDHRLRLISTAIFSYAVLDVVEGVGLLLEKAWAEYLTIIVTASFLPWEMFEVARHASVIKIVLFLTNAAVVAYLVYDVRRHARIREELDEAERRTQD
jgi:uncharacterized membrane protein (DUF2068 family)